MQYVNQLGKKQQLESGVKFCPYFCINIYCAVASCVFSLFSFFSFILFVWKEGYCSIARNEFWLLITFMLSLDLTMKRADHFQTFTGMSLCCITFN